MRQRKAAALVAFLGFALTGLAVAQEPGAEGLREVLALVGSPDRLIAESRLDFVVQRDGRIVGSLELEYDAQRVSFTSVKGSRNVVELRVELGDVILEASADLEHNTRVLDGHDHALTLGERLALVALTYHLEQELQPYSKPLSPEADLLFRVCAYWSDAPMGMQLPRIELEPPSFRGVCNPVGSASGTCPSGCEDFYFCEDGFFCGNAFSGDGVCQLGGGCQMALYDLEHDACGEVHAGCSSGVHDYCYETIPAGCSLACECLGRCTAGCGSQQGAGLYTKDCAEHDRCCRVHNSSGCWLPGDLWCDDEYLEAADDVAYGLLPGTDNCSNGCGCPNGVCDPGETCSSCPQDCATGCGDGCCTGNENRCNCSSDCGTTFCGDGCCGSGETRCNCPSDCGTTFCGDGCCGSGENRCNCASDCGSTFCGDGCCGSGENRCNCSSDCGSTFCGDGCCGSGENSSNCCEDCGATCGDGICSTSCGETSGNCCQDCGCCSNSDCNWPCEECVGGSCQPRNTCGDNSCNCGENSGSCCEDCPCPDDGLYCNSSESCVNGNCTSSGSPCGGATPVCCEVPGGYACEQECCDDTDCPGGEVCCDGVCGCCPTPGTCCQVWADVVGGANDENPNPGSNCRVDLSDVFCELNGFEAATAWADVCPDGDLVGNSPSACGGNGTINIFDVFASLNAFSDPDNPTCPHRCPLEEACAEPPRGTLATAEGAGPGEMAVSTVESADLTIKLSSHRIRAGQVVTVDLYIGDVSDLRGYQLALNVFGGASGVLTIEEIRIEKDRAGYVFASMESVTATDKQGKRVVNALFSNGASVKDSAYLATFVLRASADAQGAFSIAVRAADTLLGDSTGAPIILSSKRFVTVYVGTPPAHRRKVVRD